jgi:hypothetical protein
MTDELLVEFRTREEFLVLEFGRKVDAVVFADVADSFGWKLMGVGANAEDF